MIQYTKEHIGRLLDKFMEGTSTLEEEDILSQYFAQGQIPAEWEEYRLLFAEFEAMKSQSSAKPRRRWIGWGVAAAAVVAGVLYLTMPSRQTDRNPDVPLMALADSTTTQQAKPDTASSPKEQVLPVQTKKRSLRKPAPTMTDYDKAYALTAEAERAKRNVELELEQARQEVIDAQLAAYGFIPVMQEDGTIIYINEQNELIAYEE